MMNQIAAAVVFVVAFASWSGAQITNPTQAEKDAWAKDPNTKILESSPCKQITWLLEGERKESSELPKQPIRYALGWWGRGFVEGGVYMVPGDKAVKAAADFGLSVEVVAAHISTYCYSHETETPFDAIQNLLLKVMNTAK
jgi:hypothetical protein